MEKIRKRKAIFRVEFQIYAVDEGMFKAACIDLAKDLENIKEFISLDPMRGYITSLAQVSKVRRLAG